ncbi:MAG TPA: hypothetical protein VGG08_10660 [Solirubrobacteraceae bacterium]
MERFKTLRNIAIIAAIAVAVYYVPGGGRAASAVEAALWVLFGLALGFIGLRYYRERRVTIAGLGDRGRGLAYGVLALVLFLFEARWWVSIGGFRELLWFLLAGVGVWAVMEIYRQARSY